jgi:hypothetical protein
MIAYQNRGRREGDQIVWLLFNHRIEFIDTEFEEILHAIRNGGLFAYLDRERPALRSRLTDILSRELPEGIFPSALEEEFYLEQCILGLGDRLR